MSQDAPFNPLDKRNLAESVALAALEHDARPLTLETTEDVAGEGVYLIYYCGPFDAYEPLTPLTRGVPAAPAVRTDWGMLAEQAAGLADGEEDGGVWSPVELETLWNLRGGADNPSARVVAENLYMFVMETRELSPNGAPPKSPNLSRERRTGHPGVNGNIHRGGADMFPQHHPAQTGGHSLFAFSPQLGYNEGGAYTSAEA